MSSILNIAVAGLNNAASRVANSASTIANAASTIVNASSTTTNSSPNDSNLTSALVAIKADSIVYSANAKVVKVVANLDKALIDIKT